MSNNPRQTISESYKKENELLHMQRDDGKRYGESNFTLNNKTCKVVEIMCQQKIISSVLDYGCGKGLLIEQLEKDVAKEICLQGYDPGNPKFNQLPNEADFVTCFDVLEHVEDSYIENTLDDIKHLTQKIACIVIDLMPAKKQLSDGRNAHILLAPPAWWTGKLIERFEFACYGVFRGKNNAKKLVFTGSKEKKYYPLCAQIHSKVFY